MRREKKQDGAVVTPTLDDAARLTRGKASRSKVGSRAISHRLKAYELEKLKIAAGRGYLIVNESTRSALINSWLMSCKARVIECVLLKRVNGLEIRETIF